LLSNSGAVSSSFPSEAFLSPWSTEVVVVVVVENEDEVTVDMAGKRLCRIVSKIRPTSPPPLLPLLLVVLERALVDVSLW